MPNLKLTKRAVEAQEPGQKDIILWDTEIKGFGCKVTPKGKKSYFLYYRNQSGSQRRPAIGTHGAITAEQARSIAQQWKADIANGNDPSKGRKEAKEAPSMSELCNRYLDEHSAAKNRESTYKNNLRIIEKHIRPKLGNRKVREITSDDIATLHHHLRHTPYQANRVLSVMSKMMKLAATWKYIDHSNNPTIGISKFPEEERERYLSPHELERLSSILFELEEKRAEMPSVINAIRLLIATGCRLSEILTMKWDWVDLENQRLYLPTSKTGKKTVYLNGLAIELLKGISPIEDNPHVIVGAKEGTHLINLQRPWRRIRKLANLEDVRIHDLRHSFASVAAGLGQDLHMIGKLLGHTQTQTTRRYAHLADDPVQSANNRVGEALATMMNAGKTKET